MRPPGCRHWGPEFPESIVVLRKQRGMKQADLAEAARVTRQTIGSYEAAARRHESSNPTLLVIDLMAKALAVNPSQLVCGGPVHGVGRFAGDLIDQVGATIRVARQKQGLSVGQLAGRIGMGRTHLAWIEEGLSQLHLLTLDRIASGVGRSRFDLLRGAELHAEGRREFRRDIENHRPEAALAKDRARYLKASSPRVIRHVRT